ncbi:MAG: hypothetical protein ACI910_000565 [Oleispira sp.]|jgi:hypothetical protein
MNAAQNLVKIEDATEWIAGLSEQGWCWYTGDEKGTFFWNRYTDTRNSLDSMLLKAAQHGINKAQARPMLNRRLATIDGVRFEPAKPEVFEEYRCRYSNSFRSMKHIVESIRNPEEDMSFINGPDYNDDPNECPKELLFNDAEPFREFILRLTSNDEDYEWLMCWMAHMIQKPAERPSVHPLFRTAHGIGKNVLVEQVLNKLLAGNTATTSLREIGNTHSETIANNLLVFVDESKAKGIGVYLKLKSILASKEATINPKYVRPYQQNLYARFMFADNTEGRAFSIEQEDRRIYVMEYVVHERDKAETQEFIEDFLGWWGANYDTAYQYLYEYDISGWSPYVCPMTKAKKDYLGMCNDQHEDLIKKYQEDTGRMSITEASWNRFIGFQGYALEISEQLQWTASHLNKNAYFKRKLEAVGFRDERPLKRIDGVQKRVSAWILTNCGARSKYDLVMSENEAEKPTERACSGSESVESGVTV